MLDTVDFNHVQHISFTQSRLTDAVSVILSELLSYEHPPNHVGYLVTQRYPRQSSEAGIQLFKKHLRRFLSTQNLSWHDKRT